MTTIIDPETKRKGIETFVKVAVIGVFCAVTAPLAFSALEGLLAWAAFGGAVLLGWSFAPIVATFVANKRIQALKAVIAANPIETMQNISAAKQEELNAQSKAITTVNTQYLNVQTLINNLPPKLKAKAANYQAIADKLKIGLDQMKRSYDFAAQKLAEYNSQIDEAQSLWEVACAVNTAVKVSEKAKLDVFRDIKEKVAFETVTTGLNHAFASLDEVVRVNQTITDLGSVDSEPAALPPVQTAEVIDLGTVRSKVRVN